jgi:hypothetical protein
MTWLTAASWSRASVAAFRTAVRFGAAAFFGAAGTVLFFAPAFTLRSIGASSVAGLADTVT